MSNFNNDLLTAITNQIQTELKPSLNFSSNLSYSSPSERILSVLNDAENVMNSASIAFSDLKNFYIRYDFENPDFKLDQRLLSSSREAKASLTYFYIQAMASIFKSTIPDGKTFHQFLTETINASNNNSN